MSIPSFDNGEQKKKDRRTWGAAKRNLAAGQ